MAKILRTGEFQMECNVLFGSGVISQVGERVKQMNGSKVFVVTGPHIHKAGLIEPCKDNLKAAGLEIMVWDDVKPDPVDAAIEEATEAAVKFGADSVIGIGGGSPQDTAKMVAVLLANPGKKCMDFSLSKGYFIPPHVPLIIIPTASGAGSEASRVAVFSDHRNHAKDSALCSANLALFDPDFTVSAAPHVTAASGFDCFAHCIEAYTARRGDPISELLALQGLKMIVKYLPRAYDDGNDMEARSHMALASNLAGIAFNNTGVQIGHTVAHEIGGVFGIPHGCCCAFTLAEVAKFNINVRPEFGYGLAEAMGVELPENPTPAQMGELIQAKCHEIMRHCNMKSMKDYGITREAAVACAADAIEHNFIFYNNGSADLDVEGYKTLIGNMYDNYQ